jgi:TatD DNase family protein
MIQAVKYPPIVDTHTHLDEPAFAMDRDEVLAASRSAGVSQFINIAYKPEQWDSSRMLRETYLDIAIAVGVHPQESARFDVRLEHQLVRAIEELRPIAIGETGFDFARSSPSPLDQARAFSNQLEIAAHTGLPVIIHHRVAIDALMIELDRWPKLPAIALHSFDGNRRPADWAIERSCYIGVGGLATKRASTELRALLERMPTTQLLLETDSPYLPPPGAESRRNTPANLPLIANILGPLWNLTGEELCQTTTRNAERLFAKSCGVQWAGARQDSALQ